MYNALRDAVTDISVAFRWWLRSPAWWAWLVIAVATALAINWLT
jgi:hypothetical protein